MSSSPPTVVADRYRLVAPLGQGGMGRVWRATDVVLHRDVAIKELVPPPGLTPGERQEMRERSLREARAIARLNNVNVVRVFDVLRTDADPWIVMEYVASRSLQDTLAQDGPFTPVRAAEIGLGVLGALRAAHRAGVVHRDVKPGNVLIGADGRVVLTDFGLATVPGDPNVTRTGLVLGSPAYIAPERARDGTAGPGADLWSLGATLYAAVEGASPFARPSAIATLAALATENPPPARNAGPLKPVLNGLLRKDPTHRINAEEAERLLLRAAGRRSKLTFPMSPTMRRPGVGRERPALPGHQPTGAAPVVPGPRPPVAPARPVTPPGRPPASGGRPAPGEGRPPVFVPGKAPVGRPVDPPAKRPADTPTRVDGPMIDATRLDGPAVGDDIPRTPSAPPTAPTRRPALDEGRSGGAAQRGTVSRTTRGEMGSFTAADVAANRRKQAAPEHEKSLADATAFLHRIDAPVAEPAVDTNAADATTLVGPAVPHADATSVVKPAPPSAEATSLLKTPSQSAEATSVVKPAPPSAEATSVVKPGTPPAEATSVVKPGAPPVDATSVVKPATASAEATSLLKSGPAKSSPAPLTEAAALVSPAAPPADVTSLVSPAAPPPDATALVSPAAPSTKAPEGTGSAGSDPAEASLNRAEPAKSDATSKVTTGAGVTGTDSGATDSGTTGVGAVGADVTGAGTKASDSAGSGLPETGAGAAAAEASSAVTGAAAADATGKPGPGKSAQRKAAEKRSRRKNAATTAAKAAPPKASPQTGTTAPSVVSPAGTNAPSTESQESSTAERSAVLPESDSTASPDSDAVAPSAASAESGAGASAASSGSGTAERSPASAESGVAASSASGSAATGEDSGERRAGSLDGDGKAALSEGDTERDTEGDTDGDTESAEAKSRGTSGKGLASGLESRSEATVADRTVKTELTSAKTEAAAGGARARKSDTVPPVVDPTMVALPVDRAGLIDDDDQEVPLTGLNRPSRPAWRPMEIRPPASTTNGVTVFGTRLTYRQAAIGAGIVALVLVLIVVLIAQAFGDDDKPVASPTPAPSATGAAVTTKPSAAATSKAPATSATPSPPPSTPASNVTLPDGWELYADSTGFKVPVPKGASKSRDGSQLEIKWDNRLLLIDQSKTPKPDTLEDWKQQEQDRAGRDYRNYQKVRMVRVNNYFQQAADWEFYYTTKSSNNRQHAVKRNIIVNDGQAYSLSWYVSPDDWDASQDDLKLIYQGFQPRK